MKVSVIIPVWHGEEVIARCLEAVYAHSGDALHEVICVDNDAQDSSTTIIADQFPQAKLLPQAINLGFSGGVNVGMEAANGDILLLLNQDCIVHEGWLDALLAAFETSSTTGIVGGTIFNADGSVNHMGAVIKRPSGFGEHVTSGEETAPHAVEYVTGALFGIHRQVWEKNGRFDDDFYPAYFEETDYCYRARRNGFDVVHAPAMQATHLLSGREWLKDPLKNTANQHRSRYRFVLKHFLADEYAPFFAAEIETIKHIKHYDQRIGRLLAIRDTLRDLTTIIASRIHDGGTPLTREQVRFISVNFSLLWRVTWQLLMPLAPHPNQPQLDLDSLREQEYALLEKIYFKHPTDKSEEKTWKRYWRVLVLRFLSIITLREHFLHIKLTTVQVARMDALNQWHRQQTQQLDIKYQHYLQIFEQMNEYEYR